MMTQLRLRELFNYDPDTGYFVNRRLLRNAGCINSHGYRVINIGGEQFRAARLAWLYMTGEWPDEHIDHVNGKTDDDRWVNLREATRSENMRNMKLRADSSSGLRGVSWNTRRQKYHARVHVHGRTYHCGYFDSPVEAAAARDARAIQLHGAFVKLNQLTKGAIQ